MVSLGAYPFNLIRFSISGIPNSDQLTVSLDGNDLGWEVQKDVGIDRYFYDFLKLEDDSRLGQGNHSIEFVLNYPPASDVGGGPQLCSVEVLEYGGSEECAFISYQFLFSEVSRLVFRFNSSAGYYGIFPTCVTF